MPKEKESKMREIKFRGKRVDGNGWVYGHYFYDNVYKKAYICFVGEKAPSYLGHLSVEVIPETVGQYTGLKDKKGKEIYEGDGLKTQSNEILIVIWVERFGSFGLEKKGWMYTHYFTEAVLPNEVEVIGNIPDNPELLK